MATERQEEDWPHFFEYQEDLKNLDAQIAAYKGDKESDEFRELQRAQRYAQTAYQSTVNLICDAETEGLPHPDGRIKVPLRRSFLKKVDVSLLEQYGRPHTQYLAQKIRAMRKVRDDFDAV